MPSKKILTPIEPGGVYHVFNRGINHQNVFFCKEDYFFFIKTFKLYMSDVTHVYAYVLLPNHYHFLLKVKESLKPLEFSMQFRKFMLSYTNTINKRDLRSGALFLSMFKRLEVRSENYLIQLLCYIHLNPANHHITDHYQSYEFSSYKAYMSNKPTLIKKNEIFDLFGDKQNFIYYHGLKHDEDFLKDLSME